MAMISIIVPVYNVGPYLERCVQSLLGQSMTELEIVLVDDGSTDNSPELCREFAASDDRIRLIRKENGGLADARNAGLAVARGEYIGFVDGDDWIEEDTCLRMAEIIARERPDVIRFGYRKLADGAVTGSFSYPYGDGLYTGEELSRLRLDSVGTERALDYGYKRIMSACTGLYRRSLLEENRVLFESERELLNEDYLFVMQVMRLAGSVYICNRELYRYVTRPGSLTTVYRGDMYRRKKNLFARYLALLPADEPETALRLRNFYIDCIYDCIVNEIRAGDMRRAVPEIRKLLSDERLRSCLRESRGSEGGAKAKCICFLMRHGMAATMYCGYRLAKK